ncbi:MAG: AMP-binding protein [Pseudomonadota bacterium]|jgi:2-aminobenzoate-CoA ligase|uniref:Acyl-coenzyme A synthetases/AMP-(Fatty) acid ligases n=1 Tax=hydrothermal vent metagenome TaxID=652676 RepID=A0A160TN93_9ZZZZ
MITVHVDTFVRDRLPPSSLQPEFRFDLPELHYPDRLNAAVALLEGHDPHAVAIINETGSWTYGQLQARSDAIARILVEQEGLVPGNRVLLRGPNTALMFTAWLGVLKAGGVVVATMPILRGSEITTILDRARITHAIVDRRSLSDFQAAQGNAPTLRSCLIYDGDAGTGDVEARMAAVAPGFEPIATHRDDPALIAFTSGTTGKPKGCVQFHRDILAPADTFARHIIAPTAQDRWLCSAPIAFTFGLGMQLIFPLRFGGVAVTAEQSSPQGLLGTIERFGVTILATAPTAYKAMLGIISRIPSSLRLCVSAGEHLPETVWHAWRDATGLEIVNGLGATEMMHIFVSAAGTDNRPGATGRAVPGYEVTILDQAGRAIATGTGRLAVKGPTGCRYLDDRRQADYVINGWNITGDTYRRDEDGYFHFVARSDDMIVSSGYNIGAPEVEKALYGHPAVLECAVIGVPCVERGMKVKAFIVVAEGYTADPSLAKALQDHVKAAIAPYKYPREIAFLDALPKTATGKIQRFALRQASVETRP